MPEVYFSLSRESEKYIIFLILQIFLNRFIFLLTHLSPIPFFVKLLLLDLTLICIKNIYPHEKKYRK